ncbi:MAG: alpha/beta fold hydrolase [Brevibacterium sp.]|uniref:thioesterase domain-containing protein n=1 Tax=Brevibacterium TaxID=1696 RepID=UPI003F904331
MLDVDSEGPPAVPLAMIHPGAMDPSVWTELREQWGGELTVIELDKTREYLLEALGQGDGSLTVDSLAADVERELRTHLDFTSKWLLAGWSFGGVVANSTLRRLTDDELPAGLCLLDSIAAVPGYVWEVGDARELSGTDRAQAFDWFSMYLSAKQGVDLGLSTANFLDKDQDGALLVVLERARERAAPVGSASIEGLNKVFKVFVAGLHRNNRLAGEHSAPSCRVTTTLVRPDHSLLVDDQHMGWDQISDGLNIVDVPGDHYSMVNHPDAVRKITDALISIL